MVDHKDSYILIQTRYKHYQHDIVFGHHRVCAQVNLLQYIHSLVHLTPYLTADVNKYNCFEMYLCTEKAPVTVVGEALTHRPILINYLCW